jgi:hypothetical protein
MVGVPLEDLVRLALDMFGQPLDLGAVTQRVEEAPCLPVSLAQSQPGVGLADHKVRRDSERLLSMMAGRARPAAA